MTRSPRSRLPLNQGVLPQLLGYQLRLSQVAVFRDFADNVGDAQITPSLFAVLVTIDANPGLKQTELATAVRLDRSTVVSVIDKLQRQQLVSRQRVDGDRRTNSLQLTDQGRELLEQLLPQVLAHDRRLAEQLTTEEREILIGLLGRILPQSR